jgi:outer membrane protein
MKKILFLLALGITVGFNAKAEKKTAYINSQELLETMPEARKADSSLAKYQSELESTLKGMFTEYQNKMKDYETNATKWSEPVRETKEKEIRDLQNRLQESQQSAEEKMSKKRGELMKPILEKAQNAIKAVGAEGGYDYIFDGSQLLYAKESENIMPQVKAKLGIK